MNHLEECKKIQRQGEDYERSLNEDCSKLHKEVNFLRRACTELEQAVAGRRQKDLSTTVKTAWRTCDRVAAAVRDENLISMRRVPSGLPANAPQLARDLESRFVEQEVHPHTDLVASLGGSPTGRSMSVNILRLHGPVVNSPSGTDQLELIQSARKTKKSNSELIQCVETWIQNGRLCPKKADVMSYFEMCLKENNFAKAAVKELRREVKESFGSIDARRERTKFQIEARRWFQERPTFRVSGNVQLHTSPLNEPGTLESAQASLQSPQVPTPPVILSAPIPEVSTSNSDATGSLDVPLQPRVQQRRLFSSRNQTFPNAEGSHIAGWETNPRMPPPPPSASAHVGSVPMGFHHDEEFQDNVREAVLPGAASLEDELYDPPNSRRATQDGYDATGDRQLRKRARHSL